MQACSHCIDRLAAFGVNGLVAQQLASNANKCAVGEHRQWSSTSADAHTGYHVLPESFLATPARVTPHV